MDDAPGNGCVSKGGPSVVPPLLLSPYRLPTDRYEKVFESGQSFACKTLILRWCANDEGKTCVGVISPKRVFRLAVERSRARRLMREAFRLERPFLKPGYDIVLLGRGELKGKQCQLVRRDLRWMCRKIGLLLEGGERA